MKKSAVLLLVLIMALTSACAPPATEVAPAEPAEPAATSEPAAPAEPAAAEKGVIAVALPALDNPLMLALKDAFVNTFGTEYDVQVASADGNPNTQATQIENYTGMAPKLMFVMAVEASSLLPKLEAARAEGIPVMVVGGEPGESGRDAVMKLDQFLAGEYAALMAKNWVEETYPDAADGSIETAVFTSTLNTDAVDRTNGLLMISEPFLKNSKGEYIDATGAPISDDKGAYLAGKSEADRVPNPVYVPAVKIVATPAAEMFQAGQTTMQNVLTTNPNVKLVLAYASDGGAGASQAIMDEFAKGANSAIQDLAKVAVFGVGMFGPEADAIVASSKGEGVFRGAVAFGGGDLPGSTVAIASQILNGEDYPAVTWDPLALATVVNGELNVVPMANSGVISGTP
jgi:ABC-type sugar transport system substrate-binding protein